MAQNENHNVFRHALSMEHDTDMAHDAEKG